MSVILSYSALLLTSISAFMAVSLPRGWPQKSFFLHVPKPQQTLVISILLLTFLLPVFVSCVTYFGVYYSVVIKQINKVGINVDSQTKIDIEIKSCQGNLDIFLKIIFRG